MTASDLATPPTALEVQKLLDDLQQVILYPGRALLEFEAIRILRRLAFDRDRLQMERRAEQERCIALIRRYLQFGDQRAVSYHEVNDCVDAIRRGDNP